MLASQIRLQRAASCALLGEQREELVLVVGWAALHHMRSLVGLCRDELSKVVALILRLGHEGFLIHLLRLFLSTEKLTFGLKQPDFLISSVSWNRVEDRVLEGKRTIAHEAKLSLLLLFDHGGLLPDLVDRLPV